MNTDNLTLDEIETIENLAGLPLNEMFGDGKLIGRSQKAMAFVIAKRTNPAITMEEIGKMTAGESLKIITEGLAPKA